MLQLKQITVGWNKFFFEPKPVEGIALFRIFWGLILLSNLYFYCGAVEDFYGPQAIITPETVNAQFPYWHLNVFKLFPAKIEMIHTVLGVYAIALVGVILGLYTRTSLIISLICLVSLHHRNIWLLSSADFLMRLITLYMVFSPCGKALSLDNILKRKKSPLETQNLWAPWVQRLLQIQISVVYVWTAWHKCKGDAWFDGSAVYYATRLQDFYHFSVPYLLDSEFFLKLMTWGTLALEFALGTLVWIKEFRKPVIILGIVFHLGIEFTMSIPYFEFIMVALLFLMFTPEEVKAWVQSGVKFAKKIHQDILNEQSGLGSTKTN